jgi:hypothetical protein
VLGEYCAPKDPAPSQIVVDDDALLGIGIGEENDDVDRE